MNEGRIHKITDWTKQECTKLRNEWRKNTKNYGMSEWRIHKITEWQKDFIEPIIILMKYFLYLNFNLLNVSTDTVLSKHKSQLWSVGITNIASTALVKF